MEYLVMVEKTGGTDCNNRVYSQVFYKLDVSKLVKTLNESYWADAKEPEKEEA